MSSSVIPSGAGASDARNQAKAITFKPGQLFFLVGWLSYFSKIWRCFR